MLFRRTTTSVVLDCGTISKEILAVDAAVRTINAIIVITPSLQQRDRAASQITGRLYPEAPSDSIIRGETPKRSDVPAPSPRHDHSRPTLGTPLSCEPRRAINMNICVIAPSRLPRCMSDSNGNRLRFSRSSLDGKAG